MNRGVTFGVGAALEALADSGLKITEENADMVGVIFSSGGGGTDMVIEYQRILEEKGPRRVTPFLVANFIADAASGHIAIATGARGPNMAIVSACATGGGTLGEAFETIRRGDADAVISGSSEAVLLPLYHATWCSMRALAGDNEHPEKALKPFDLNRDGFIAGEGGASMILEDYDQAKARGANIYCEIIGYGSSNDAYDMISLHETGRGLKRAVNAAIRKAADRSVRDRLHQPSRQRHTAQRPRRDDGLQRDHGSGRLQGVRQFGEAHHRALHGGIGFGRSACLRDGHPRPEGSADHQLHYAGPGVRPRLRTKRCAAASGVQVAMTHLGGTGRTQLVPHLP